MHPSYSTRYETELSICEIFKGKSGITDTHWVCRLEGGARKMQVCGSTSDAVTREDDRRNAHLRR